MAKGGTGIKFDTREFDRALRELQKTSSKEAAFFLNDQARRFAFEALKQTPKADAAAIEHTLGQKDIFAGRISRGKNRGKKKFKKGFVSTDTLAHRLVNAIRWRTGEPLLFGHKLDTEAKKLVTARKRGVGYMKSGWLPAIKRLSAALGKAGRGARGVRQFGRPKGAAIPAKATVVMRMAATVINEAVQPFTKNSYKRGHALAIANVAARSAMAVRMRDMKKQLEKRMAGVFKQYNAR